MRVKAYCTLQYISEQTGSLVLIYVIKYINYNLHFILLFTVFVWAAGWPRSPTNCSLLFLCSLTTDWLWLVSFFHGHYLLTADRGVTLFYWSLQYWQRNQISIIPNVNAKKSVTFGFQIHVYAPSWITGQRQIYLTSIRSPPVQWKHSLTVPMPRMHGRYFCSNRLTHVASCAILFDNWNSYLMITLLMATSV
jgi:hypothetical protein